MQRRGTITKRIGIRFLWGDAMALTIYATGVVTLAAITSRKHLD